ncbi:Uncharacterised protein r2_g957 [Pycnogonum litorale]
MLIHEHRNLNEEFEGNRLLKKILWRRIAEKLNDQGYNITAAMCEKSGEILKRHLYLSATTILKLDEVEDRGNFLMQWKKPLVINAPPFH